MSVSTDCLLGAKVIIIRSTFYLIFYRLAPINNFKFVIFILK